MGKVGPTYARVVLINESKDLSLLPSAPNVELRDYRLLNTIFRAFEFTDLTPDTGYAVLLGGKSAGFFSTLGNHGPASGEITESTQSRSISTLL